MMQLSDFEFVQLTKDTPLLPFVSEDEDLNNFLMEDAKNYSADLMAVTYLFIDKKKQQIVAYFSLLNDKMAYDPRERSIWNRINRLIPNQKRRRSYPSAKIGRLAVGKEYAHEGLGSQIIEFIEAFLVANPKLGCRFLTVDAPEMKYVCNVCGWVYDEEETGVKWEDLPDDFACELCGVGKEDFSPEE